MLLGPLGVVGLQSRAFSCPPTVRPGREARIASMVAVGRWSCRLTARGFCYMVCKPKTRVSIADPGRNSVMLEE